MGYAQEYYEFLKWILTYKDRNFLLDLNYDVKHEHLMKFFNQDSVTWLYFDCALEYGVNPYLNKKLSKWLGIENKNIEISITHISLDKDHKISLLEYNKLFRRSLNKPQTKSFEKHRLRKQFKCKYIKNTNSIFIDASHSERMQVHKYSGIPVFAPDSMENLLN